MTQKKYVIKKNHKESSTQTETVISYEDFAKEAQSTLYRETSN